MTFTRNLLISIVIVSGLGGNLWASSLRTESADNIKSSDQTKTYTLPSATTTLTGRDTTDTLTNKSISGSTNTLTNISLTTSVTGTLPVANGGFGLTTLTANNVILGNGTSAPTFVAPGTSGNVLTSNGTTWSSSAGSSSASLNPQVSSTLAAHAAGIWQNSSTNGFSALSTSFDWNSVVYVPQLNSNSSSDLSAPRFIAVGTSDRSSRMTRFGGWTTVNSLGEASNSWNSVTYSPELYMILAVGTSGSTHKVMTSINGGSTWTGQTAAAANNWTGVTWSPDLSLFCAVSSGGTNRVMTSPDGVTWTSRSAAAANSWQAVTWSSEKLLFVAVSNDGTNRVMTSPDGTTWTSRSASSARGWDAIVWSPEKSLFVAVQNGLAGTSSGAAMTSPDGITWTDRTLVGNGTNWRGVSWSAELGLFAAVNRDGTDFNIATSPDGTTWTGYLFNSGTQWTGLSWGPQFGTFMSVGNSDGVDNSMNSLNVKKFIAP